MCKNSMCLTFVVVVMATAQVGAQTSSEEPLAKALAILKETKPVVLDRAHLEPIKRIDSAKVAADQMAADRTAFVGKWVRENGTYVQFNADGTGRNEVDPFTWTVERDGLGKLVARQKFQDGSGGPVYLEILQKFTTKQ